MNQIQIKMDLIVAHKIIQQIDKRDKEKKEKENIEHKDTIERIYSKSCGYCGQNLVWCICKNNIFKNK